MFFSRPTCNLGPFLVTATVSVSWRHHQLTQLCMRFKHYSQQGMWTALTTGHCWLIKAKYNRYRESQKRHTRHGQCRWWFPWRYRRRPRNNSCCVHQAAQQIWLETNLAGRSTHQSSSGRLSEIWSAAEHANLTKNETATWLLYENYQSLHFSNSNVTL